MLREQRPDLYLSPFYVMPMGAGCPCVLVLHDVLPLRLRELMPWSRRAAFGLLVRLARGARCVVTSSEFSRREILALTGMAAAQVRVVRPGAPPALDPDHCRPPGRAVPERFALVVGINKPHKNLETLVRAWARLGAETLCLVGVGGEDPRYPGLATLAGEAGARHVIALGRLGEAELGWLYRRAEIVLLPSLHEGFGFPLAEAFAYGRPVIAADIPALREIGADAAELVPPHDVDAWVDTIAAVSGSGERREAMSIRSMERARALDYRECARGMLDLVREAARS